MEILIEFHPNLQVIVVSYLNVISKATQFPEWIRDAKADIQMRVQQHIFQAYYVNSQLQSLNGEPAITISGCSKEWYQDDKIHRYHWPAIICEDGFRAWYEHGNFIRSECSTKEDAQSMVQLSKEAQDPDPRNN